MSEDSSTPSGSTTGKRTAADAFTVLLANRRVPKAQHPHKPVAATARSFPIGSSHLVSCPCCGVRTHPRQLNEHLDSCRGPAPDAAAPASAAAAVDVPAASSSEPGPSANTVRVRCPICDIELRNEDVFEHLESCGGEAEPSRRGEAGSSSDPLPAASSQPADGSALAMVGCPICSLEMTMRDLDTHLDSGCEPPPPPPPPPAAAEGSQAEGSQPEGSQAEGATGQERLERMAQELTCRICFDLFTEPLSLPCCHSFCSECIHGCFKVTARMQCPLCKAPVWLRQLSPNPNLAGIVQCFRTMQEASEHPS